MRIAVVAILTVLQHVCPLWGRTLRRDGTETNSLEDIHSVLERNRQISDFLIPLLQASLDTTHTSAKERPRSLHYRDSQRTVKDKGPVVELLPLPNHRRSKTPLAIILAPQSNKKDNNYSYRSSLDHSSEEFIHSHKNSQENLGNRRKGYFNSASAETEENVTEKHQYKGRDESNARLTNGKSKKGIVKNSQTNGDTVKRKDTKVEVKQKHIKNKPKLQPARHRSNSNSSRYEETHEPDNATTETKETEEFETEALSNKDQRLRTSRDHLRSGSRSDLETQETEEGPPSTETSKIDINRQTSKPFKEDATPKKLEGEISKIKSEATLRTSGNVMKSDISDYDATMETSENKFNSQLEEIVDSKEMQGSYLYHEHPSKTLTSKLVENNVPQNAGKSESSKKYVSSEAVKEEDIPETSEGTATLKTSGNDVDPDVSDDSISSETSENVIDSESKVRKVYHIVKENVNSETSERTATLRTSGNDVDPDVSDHSISSETSENVIDSESKVRKSYHMVEEDVKSEISERSATLKTPGNDVDPDVSEHSILSETSEDVINSVSKVRNGHHSTKLNHFQKHKSEKKDAIETSEETDTSGAPERLSTGNVESEVKLKRIDLARINNCWKQKSALHPTYDKENTYSKELARKYAYDSAFSFENDIFGETHSNNELNIHSVEGSLEVLDDEVDNGEVRENGRGKKLTNQQATNNPQTHKMYKLSFQFYK